MNYVPKSEEQLAEEALLPEAIYDFEVIDTNDAHSKKGNDMITLTLRVFTGEGGERRVTDYIAMGTSFGERKLRHAADACGLIDMYMAGQIEHHTFYQATGKILVKQQKGTPEYPTPKNVVGDYIKRDEGVTDTRVAKAIIDDEIPF